MANASYQISNLLEKMTSTDKDYRFMATNDLMVELQKESVKLDDDSEKKISKMLLRLLEDKNGEVQNLAVKCLGPLVNKAKEYQVETIVDKLCENMFSEREQLRDISSIGLKTVISELPPTSSSLAASICKRITGRLSKAIAMEEEVSVQLEALDIMGDLLSRFGGLLVTYHGPIQEALLPQLSSPRLAVRKRSILAIGHLVMSCNHNLYVELIDFLLGELSQNASMSTTRTYIQCIGTISRQSGHRFGGHLERVMPFIVKYAEIDDDDELREYCLQAMESFVRRCPKEISSHVNTIIKICLKYICYDPNYNYEDDDENENSMELGEEEDGDSEEEYSDDDDMSWKVRRSSAKCLEAIISTRHELLSIYYRDVSPKLIERFKEREENVKSDIFHAYIALLKQTRTTVGVNLGADAMESTESPVFLLQNQVPQLVKVIHRQMREKSIKTRQGCFALLTELVNVLHCALTDHIDVIIPGIQFSLGEKNTSSNMKIDTLAFLNCLLSTHPPAVFHPHTKILVPLVIAAVADPFYKITSEALLVTQQLVHVIRPLDTPCVFDFTPYTLDIYRCTLVRLKAADIDQEVKERAISCMGQIISNLGDHLQNELSVCLPIFLDRLRNEITRLTTVKALTKIARSPLKIDFKPILMDAVPILASFLRKNQRSLKLSTLLLLDVLVQNYSNVLTPELFNKVMVELPPLLNESDLHVAQLTLSLLTSLAHMQKGALEKVNESVLPEIQNLVQSPLLQGAALQSMLDFFKALKEANLPWLKYHDLLNMITAPVNSPQGPAIIHKQAFHSMAKCVAALTTSHKEEAIDVVEGLLANIQKPSSDAIHLFSLLATGEIGRHIDLSCIPNLKEVFLGSFSAHSEEVKSAASYALGSVSVGNLPQFLPFVLKEIQAQPKRQYLLLHSLKEIISSQSSSPIGIMALQPFVAEIWTQLFNHCECSEEGTRNVVAECLGKLTLIDPSSLLGKLKENLKSESPLMRTTVVTAIKFTITDQPQPIDPLLKKYIGDFLSTLEDGDLNVRRVALVAFNSAAHNKPSLIRDLLESILPQLYNETKVRKMLIREVEMGPFKHTVDDGLDIRKAAFECMYTLLDSCLDRLDVFEFLNHVESGLKDHYDIKMLTYLMLVRLASLCPSGVLQKLDCLIEPLRATVTTKVKANSVKQEFEKQDELKRSALRAVAALLSIPDSDKHPGLQEFINQIKANPELELLYESIQKDTSNSVNDNLMMDLS